MLTQLATVKARLAILPTDVSQDELLTRAIAAVSARFDRECNRTLARTVDATQEFEAGETEVIAKCYPIEDVTGFELKTSEAEGWVAQAEMDYIVRQGCVISLSAPLVGLGRSAGAWLGRVTYTGGYVMPGTAPGAGQGQFMDLADRDLSVLPAQTVGYSVFTCPSGYKGAVRCDNELELGKELPEQTRNFSLPDRVQVDVQFVYQHDAFLLQWVGAIGKSHKQAPDQVSREGQDAPVPVAQAECRHSLPLYREEDSPVGADRIEARSVREDSVYCIYSKVLLPFRGLVLVLRDSVV
jgi:hypothetical protein